MVRASRTRLSGEQRDALVAAVQANCHVADARHAGELTLCTYLLQMREFFRWERGFALGATLPRDEVGRWIADRESLWADLETQGYRGVPVAWASGDDATAGREIDPFDADAVNACLRPHGLVYGAGLVGLRRPVFFLAELHGTGRRDGLEVLQAGTELARGLMAPPAALAGGGAGPIVLRRQSLARWCWERVEAHAMRPSPGSALHAMLREYALDEDFHAALPRWLDDQVETAVLHELGEYRAGQWLGPDWTALRAALGDVRAELAARALRDHLADFTVTLPALVASGRPGPLHAWFAAYDGMREAMCPALVPAYAAWRGGDGGRALDEQIAQGRARFERTAGELLALWRVEGPAAATHIGERLRGEAASVAAARPAN